MTGPLVADLAKLLWWTRSLAHRGTGRLVLRGTAVSLIMALMIAAGGADLAAIDWSFLAAYTSHDPR